MSDVEWSDDAARDLEAYLDWVNERAPGAAARIRREIVDWTELLAARPMIGNPSRWRGLRAHGKSKLHKVVIYTSTDRGIQIAAFLDTRQNNSSLRLPKT